MTTPLLLLLLLSALVCSAGGQQPRGVPRQREAADDSHPPLRLGEGRVIMGYRRCSKATADTYNKSKPTDREGLATQLGRGIVVTEQRNWWRQGLAEEFRDHHWCVFTCDLAKPQVFSKRWIKAPLPDIAGGSTTSTPVKYIRLAYLKRHDGEESYAMLLSRAMVRHGSSTMDLRVVCKATEQALVAVLRGEIPRGPDLRAEVASPHHGPMPQDARLDYRLLIADPGYLRPKNLETMAVQPLAPATLRPYPAGGPGAPVAWLGQSSASPMAKRPRTGNSPPPSPSSPYSS